MPVINIVCRGGVIGPLIGETVEGSVVYGILTPAVPLLDESSPEGIPAPVGTVEISALRGLVHAHDREFNQVGVGKGGGLRDLVVGFQVDDFLAGTDRQCSGQEGYENIFTGFHCDTVLFHSVHF